VVAPLSHAQNAPRAARLPAALALAALLLAGCVSPRLVDERRQAPYAGLLARYEALPHKPERLAVQVPGSAPVRVGLDVVTSPRGAGGAVLVLQPGILSDGSSWRFLMGELGGEHDLIAVDPPGTGASDAPDPRAAGPEGYSPTWLAAHTLGALEAWETRTGVARDYVLVGHSLGGTVVLRALADPGLGARHRDLLARVRGVVLLAPADIALERRDEKFRDLALLSDFKAGVGERLGLVQQGVREGIVDNAVRPERDALLDEALRIEALAGRPATRHAAQAMLRRFQPMLPCDRPDLPAARRLAEQERGIDKPILLMWGVSDKTLPVMEAEAIRERLASEEFLALEHVGHSIHQEGVERVAAQMRAFLARVAGARQP